MDFSKIPCAEWLEDTLRHLLSSDAEHICICALLADKTVGTAYYNCSAQDKAIIVHNIQTDIMMDVLEVNIDRIKDMLDGVEDE